MFTWPSNWKYTLSAVFLWGLFLSTLVILAWAHSAGLPSTAILALATIPGLSVVLQFFLAYRLISRQDEFARGLTAKRMIAAGGLTIALATGWSVAEQFATAPHIPMWLMYPLFWTLFAAVTPLIADSQA